MLLHILTTFKYHIWILHLGTRWPCPVTHPSAWAAFTPSSTHQHLLLVYFTLLLLCYTTECRGITLPTKVRLVNVVVFPVVMYGCEMDHIEGWATKNWCFWIAVPEKTWESLGYKEIKPVGPKINLEYLLEGLMLKLKLQYFGHLMWRANSVGNTWCWKRLRAGEEGGDKG